ncbi:DUF421 domain-containing protein [Pseudorhizobium flavum]|uniref:DUF421 domain-containing protein n=1 Tax=Pseudorhizobium flavum TaxID=1335061 RepID=UPI00376FAE17
MILGSWPEILRTLLLGATLYICLVSFIRLSGKRSVATLNAFDLLVAVALGTTFASTLLQDDIPLAEGATALGLLIFLQFLITFASVRSATAMTVPSCLTTIRSA